MPGLVRGDSGSTAAGWTCEGSGLTTGGAGGSGIGVMITGALTGLLVVAGLGAELERKSRSAPSSKSAAAAAMMA